MSIKIEIECDGYRCSRTKALDYYRDEEDVINVGWFVDDMHDAHYCPKCWPKVFEEMEDNNDG